MVEDSIGDRLPQVVLRVESLADHVDVSLLAHLLRGEQTKLQMASGDGRRVEQVGVVRRGGVEAGPRGEIETSSSSKGNTGREWCNVSMKCATSMTSILQLANMYIICRWIDDASYLYPPFTFSWPRLYPCTAPSSPVSADCTDCIHTVHSAAIGS